MSLSRRMGRLFLCALALAISPSAISLSSGSALPPGTTPLMSAQDLQTAREAVLREGEEQQRAAGEAAIDSKSLPLISQCERLLRQRSHAHGVVRFLSARRVEAKTAYVDGQAAFPRTGGRPEVRHYQCIYSKDRTAIVDASVGGGD